MKDRLARHFVQPGASLRQPGTSLRQPGTSLRQPGTPLRQPGASLRQPGASLIKSTHQIHSLLVVDVGFFQFELQQCHDDDDNKQHE